VAILQGSFGNDGETVVPKIACSLRDFTRVLARGGVRMAKTSNGLRDWTGWQDNAGLTIRREPKTAT
jgi:hypothetical protein